MISCVNMKTDKQTDQDIKEVDTTLMMQFDGNDDEESDTSDTGLSLQVSGGFERDVEDYNKQRGTAEFHFKRGLVLFSINNYAEGIKEFDTTITLSPKLTSAFVNRGKGYLRLEKYSNALNDFQQAVNLDNKDSTAYLYLALAYYHLGNIQKCIEANTEYVKLAPKSSTAYFNRGTAYGRLNDLEHAISDFAKPYRLTQIMLKHILTLGYLIIIPATRLKHVKAGKRQHR